MKLGMNIRNWGPTATSEFLRACAEAADRSSLDAIWFNDHLGMPPAIAKNDYGISTDMGDIMDPLAFGAFLAACTKRIDFGTGVLILPYRPPIVTSKLLSTIQALSGNRFLLGVGPGYLEEEFRALGVPRTKRGQLTDSMIDFLRECAKAELVEQHGQPFLLKPRLNCPPIYIGGSAAVAIPRAVRCGDGWMPVGAAPAELAPQIAEMHQRGADVGRQGLDVVAMKTLPLENMAAAIEMAQGYRDAGVTHLVHTQGYASPQQYAEVVDQVDGAIRSAL
ncbi:MAG: putative F420-dependent oxidoreductase [Gammaproteobacteria bacterium]|jgi:probable F420-dependent oxidoreductase